MNACKYVRYCKRAKPRSFQTTTKLTNAVRCCLLYLTAIILYVCLRSVYTGLHVDLSSYANETLSVRQDSPVGCAGDYLGLSEYAETLCKAEFNGSCEKLTCRNLLRNLNNTALYMEIRDAMKKHRRTSIPDSYFVSAASDCGRFLKDHGYHITAQPDEDPDFAIAFNILAHTNAAQVERLLRALYRPQNAYCIHVDRKAPQTFHDALRAVSGCFENVFIASRLESIVYWGYSRLQADINCMRDHVNGTRPWRYLINTAATAYPVRTAAEMTRILKIYNGANDIEGIYGRRVLKSRFQVEWIENTELNHVARSGRRNVLPPHDIDVVRGSAYGIFSRAFVQFLLTDQRAVDLLNWSRKILTPDELYWATLHHTYANPHLRTPGGYKGYPESKPWLAVYAEWDSGKCHGQWVHSICVFGLEDLANVISRKEFFVNKFYSDFEPLAMDCLEAWYRQRTACPVQFDENFYRNLPFIRK